MQDFFPSIVEPPKGYHGPMNNSVYSNGSAGHLCGVDQHGQQLPDPAPKQLQLGPMADFSMGKSWFNGYLCWANLDLQFRNFKIGLLPQLVFWRKKAPISSNPYADNAFAHHETHRKIWSLTFTMCMLLPKLSRESNGADALLNDWRSPLFLLGAS